MDDAATTPRQHAAGGWRRAVIGLLVGAGFGAWVTRVVEADRDWPPASVRDLSELWRGRPR